MAMFQTIFDTINLNVCDTIISGNRRSSFANNTGTVTHSPKDVQAYSHRYFCPHRIVIAQLRVPIMAHAIYHSDSSKRE